MSSAARSRLSLAFVLALAIAARAATYEQIREGPSLHLHAWTQSDMSFFDRWARAIEAGDYLTRADMRPYHERHRTLACGALAIEQPAAVCDDAAIARIWDRWVGKGTLWQDPLYPYLLAAIYAAVGPEGDAVYFIHAIAGVGCVWLVFSIARALFGLGAATVAGVLAAVYGPLIFFETLRLREVALTFAGLATVRLALGAIDAVGSIRWLATGMAAGACLLLKSSSIGFVAVLGALAAVVGGLGTRRAAAVGAFALGLLLVALPLAARNVAVGISPWHVAATGPLNFLNGNAADHVPGGGSQVSSHAREILMRTGGRGGNVLRDTIATHASTADWLELLARKFLRFWNAEEIPNNASYPYFVLQSPWLGKAPGFGVVAPLALLGFALGLARDPRSVLLLLYVASHVAVCVVFFNLSRFRLPAAVAMLPFAGMTVAWVVDAAATRRLVPLLAAVAVLTAAAIAVNAEPKVRTGIRIADYGVNNEITEQIVDRRAATGDTAGALAVLARQLETEPAELRSIEPGATPTRISRDLSGIAGTFAPLYERLARLSAASGDEQRASFAHRRTAVLRALNAPYARTEGGATAAR